MSEKQEVERHLAEILALEHLQIVQDFDARGNRDLWVLATGPVLQQRIALHRDVALVGTLLDFYAMEKMTFRDSCEVPAKPSDKGTPFSIRQQFLAIENCRATALFF